MKEFSDLAIKSGIFFTFILSIFILINNLNNFDKYNNEEKGSYHLMIKADPSRYLTHGYEIKKQVLEGKNFFTSGREHYTKFLPPRIAAAYYYLLDIDLFENEEKKIIKLGIHKYYLIIQSLLYYLSVYFLFNSIKKKFERKTVFFSISFLCIEPTIFQYHGTFWSESIFFSLQIILLALIFRHNNSLKNLFLIGLFVGILSLQKQVAIFFIFPILLYIFIFFKKQFLRSCIIILTGFIFVQLFLGFSNYFRSGYFYIMTADTKVEMHRTLVERVIVNQLNIPLNYFLQQEAEESHKWIKTNKIEVNYDFDHTHTILRKFEPIPQNKNFMYYRRIIIDEGDRVQFDKFIRKRTFMFMFDYPVEFFKEIVKGAVHTPLLNPFHIYSDHRFISGEEYYGSELHKKFIPIRIIYSLLIFIIIFFGILHLLKKRDYKNLFLLVISALYFYFTIFWHGNTRYFVPCLIYLSILFGSGLNYFLSSKKT